MSSNLSKNVGGRPVDSDTKISVLMMLTNNCKDSEDDSSNTTSTTRSSKEDQINKTLAKMFVICNLAFALIDHPYFVEFIKTIRSTYNLPSHWKIILPLLLTDGRILLGNQSMIIV
ncbi:hypothetical protein C1645_812089 [Glomus cerebriforme]|uniref:Uncharacterized protein n=1 Tax=Glomus cerebriforme TaxID=658196 RepID=A0A397TR29_9GLOM|nr:hypothetical protein C1645_812089 [Glomus cerebriforme]